MKLMRSKTPIRDTYVHRLWPSYWSGTISSRENGCRGRYHWYRRGSR